MKPLADVVADFDRIAAALAAEPRERTLTRAERFLLQKVPRQAKTALDVGCGDGLLTRALAARGITTLGIDVSPGMIALARRRASADPRTVFRVADVMTTDSLGAFDVVISVSAVHHLPLDHVIPRLAAHVNPRGTLLVQDVTTRPGLRGLPMNALAWWSRRLARLTGSPVASKTVVALYDAHGRDEIFLNEATVQAAYRAILPGAHVHLHLEWRYTVVWQRN